MGNAVSNQVEINNFEKVDIEKVISTDSNNDIPLPVLEEGLKGNLDKKQELSEFDFNPRFLKACQDGNLPEVENLISQGIDYKKYSNQAVILSASSNQLKIVKYLISLGADITDSHGDAIVFASDHGHLEMVKYLVSLGMNVKTQNNRPLIYASGGGHLEMVKYLIEQGADINAQDGLALIAASNRGHFDTVKYLIDQGANIKAQRYEPLRIAIVHAHLNIVKYLVEKGSKVSNGFLNLASNENIMKYLISTGIKIPRERSEILNRVIAEIISEKITHEKIETKTRGLLPLVNGYFSPVEPLVYGNSIQIENTVKVPIILNKCVIHKEFYAIPFTIDLFDDFKVEMLPGDTLFSAELYIGQEPKFLVKRIGLNTTYGKCEKHAFFDKPVNNLYKNMRLWIKINLENGRDSIEIFRKLMIYGYICPENIRKTLDSTLPENIQEILMIKPAEL
jgi:ankyrin repeat protein